MCPSVLSSAARGVWVLSSAFSGRCCQPQPCGGHRLGATSPAPSSLSPAGGRRAASSRILHPGLCPTLRSEQLRALPPCPAPTGWHRAGIHPSPPSCFSLPFGQRQQNSPPLTAGICPHLTRECFPAGSSPGLPAQVGHFPISALWLRRISLGRDGNSVCQAHAAAAAAGLCNQGVHLLLNSRWILASWCWLDRNLCKQKII